MAVEAQGRRHMSLFSPQLIGNKIVMDGNANVYGSPVGYGGVPSTTTESVVPVYGSGMTDSFAVKSHCAMKAESGLTCNFPVCGKRTRDEMNDDPLQSLNTFLGQDIWLQIQQQQLEIDHFIAQHTEKMRLEWEQRRKRNWKRIIMMSAVEEGIVKRLEAREQEIEKIGKLNHVLEDKVKSLCVENQIWRDMAESNEATANALRSSLEQELLSHHVQYLIHPNDCLIAAAAAESSCCGSNYQDENRLDDGGVSCSKVVNDRLCRNCGQEESCVLLLPCRHLCLCSVCGSSLHTCPICKSAKNASLHVNICS